MQQLGIVEQLLSNASEDRCETLLFIIYGRLLFFEYFHFATERLNEFAL